MKRPIAWHEKNLDNLHQSFDHAFQKWKNYEIIKDSIWKDILLLDAQIDRAKREGRDGFDEEKYNVKRG